MIPAITHQTAASADLSAGQAGLRAVLVGQNPGWEHRFHTDADCRALVRRAFPDLLAIYDAYPLAVQRADMFRVVALHAVGGVYLDLDVECDRPLEPLRAQRCVLAEEITLSAEAAVALGHAERLRIANYMFASAPGHPFWLDVLEAMAARAGRPIRSEEDVLESTGPGLLSTVYARKGGAYPDIVVLPHPGQVCARCGRPSCRFGPYARHLHWGSWRGQAAASETARFVVRGHVLGSDSLAMINRAVARALEARHPGEVGFDPGPHNPPGAPTGLAGVPAPERPAIEAMTRRRAVRQGAVVISQHFPVLPPAPQAGLSLALVAWEESRLPPPMAAAISDGYDAVLATSAFTAKALIDSGVTIPVASIGQPPDLAAFAALPGPARRAGEPFTFLHVSSGFPRKGLGVLLAAWARAFKADDPVRLVIKTFPNPDSEAVAQMAAIWPRLPDCAAVEVIYRDLDEAALLDLYRRADALVSPSRGEGYNLPAIEAMAAGVPLIVTGHGGHLDFCGPDSARLIRHAMAPSTSHVASANSLWAEPDEDDLVAALREMVDPAFADVIARRAARARPAALAAADPGAWVARLERLVARLGDDAAAADGGPGAVVIEQGAGAAPWPALAARLAQARAAGQVALVRLDAVAGLASLAPAERAPLLAGLRGADRVLVASLAEVNALLDLGVADNVTLWPPATDPSRLDALARALVQARRLRDEG